MLTILHVSYVTRAMNPPDGKVVVVKVELTVDQAYEVQAAIRERQLAIESQLDNDGHSKEIERIYQRALQMLKDTAKTITRALKDVDK